MRKIIVSVSTGFVGSTKTREIEVDDEATDKDIDEAAEIELWDMINFNWQEKETK